jgi:hypothetical protein
VNLRDSLDRQSLLADNVSTIVSSIHPIKVHELNVKDQGMA